MKIKIQIHKPQLDAIILVMQCERQVVHINSIEVRSEMYSQMAAMQKLLKKQIEKAMAFDDKAFKISFSFAEGVALWKYLNLSFTQDMYRANCCEIIKNQIHPQLV